MKKISIYDTITYTTITNDMVESHHDSLEDFLNYYFLDMRGTGGWNDIAEAISSVCSTVDSIPDKGEFSNELLGLRFTVYTD